MEMTAAEKLNDYISGLKELKSSPFFPIGAVLVNEPDYAEVLKILQGQSLSPVVNTDEHPDIILKKLIEALEEGGGAMFHVQKDIHVKVRDFLNNLVSREAYVQLAGEVTPRKIKLDNPGNFLVLLMTKDFYNSSELGDIISSVCNT